MNELFKIKVMSQIAGTCFMYVLAPDTAKAINMVIEEGVNRELIMSIELLGSPLVCLN